MNALEIARPGLQWFNVAAPLQSKVYVGAW